MMLDQDVSLGVTVPIVAPSTQIVAALTRMKEARRGAVAVTDGYTTSLFTADQLLDELKARLEAHVPANIPLSQLESRAVAFQIPEDMISALQQGLVAARRNVSLALASARAQYAPLLKTDETLAIFPGTDKFQETLYDVPVTCVCSADPEHCWRPTDVTSDRKCKLDGAAVTCS
jgi:hypothetical protein